MKRLLCLSVVLSGLALVISCAAPARNGTTEESELNKRVRSSVDIVRTLTSVPERAVPDAVLRDAQGIVIIPSVLNAAFVVGGRYGNGVAVARTEDGEWSYPSFVTIQGGSLGWQAGAQSIDLVLVFKNREALSELTTGKYTIGAKAGAAAGPVGRNASANTDAQLNAEIYSYSRSRGLFAGISVEGAALRIDNASNAAFYNAPAIAPQTIFDDDVPYAPQPATQLKNTLENVTEQVAAVKDETES